MLFRRFSLLLGPLSHPLPLSLLEPSTNVLENYGIMLDRLRRAQKGVGPLTLAEKILFAHLDESMIAEVGNIKRGESYLRLHPDRVALQDASAQMTLLQFIQANRPRVARPTTVHCDHLVVAEKNAVDDLEAATKENEEVFSFLESVSRKFGLGFWGPGAGIIHQIVLENYALPGGLLIGTDSHSPNSGGLSMMGIGVGGGDAVDAMLGQTYELRMPKVIGIHLTGKLNPWCSPKDIILHVAGKLGVNGGTGFVLEYFGEGVKSLSATGMATVCNMGAELGATSSIFPFTPLNHQSAYLRAQGRTGLADLCDASVSTQKNLGSLFTADPSAFYDQNIEINLSALEPHVNGPFTPDKSTPLSQFAKAVEENKWPSKISRALIGSCTNSSYEDMSKAQHLAKQIIAAHKGKSNFCAEKDEAVEWPLSDTAPLTISPGSVQIRETMERDEISKTFTDLGATVFSNACGPCIGQWKRTDKENLSEANSILTSFNRNFAARNDGNRLTHTFLASPEIVVAMSLVGDLRFNPIKDVVKLKDGSIFRFEPPKGDILPKNGFSREWLHKNHYVAPEENLKKAAELPIAVSPTSTRLQLLQPFVRDFKNFTVDKVPILIKVRGKCTTDHINPAGPWLKYRGHLDHSADNTCIGAVNNDNGKVNSAFNHTSGGFDTIPAVARHYKANGVQWVIIGDDNYGEGSARELAAMQPRYLNGIAVIAKSLARIHEANLKKHGLLALVFKNPKDYDKISGKDLISLPLIQKELVDDFALNNHSVTMMVHKPDGTAFIVPLKHSFNAAQLNFFRAGSALQYWNQMENKL